MAIKLNSAENFNKIFTNKALLSIFDDKIGLNATSGIDGMTSHQFRRDFALHTELIITKCKAGTYSFTVYKAKLLSKGYNSCPRIVEKPTLRDRLVLRALFEILESAFTEQLVKRRLHTQIADISKSIKDLQYNCFIKLDVKNYYPSIDHEILLKQVKTKIRKVEVIKLLMASIKNTNSAYKADDIFVRDKGVPQGLSIANILANVYLTPFDKEISKIRNIKYYRYVDDILILCNFDNRKYLENKLFKEIEKYKLVFNDGDKYKVAPIHDKFDYLGYCFSNRKVSIRLKSKRKFKESIIRLLTIYKHQAKKNPKKLEFKVNLRITGFIWENKKYGWMFFFSQTENIQELFSIDHFINRQMKRYKCEELKIKKISRVYKEITKKGIKSKYIPNYDEYSDDMIIKLLSYIGIQFKNIDDAQYKFKKLIHKSILDIEQDMSAMS